MITLSIDVTLLDKARFKTVTRKNGEQAVFADLVMFATHGGQYGDWLVKQGVTKEEREARLQMPILGNGKNIGGSSQPPPSRPAPAKPKSDDPPLETDECPF